ncbi:hypothetical protein DPMN_181431 [Dreissena polymorpha]|uniref:G-protein coupled receptors family 1 profile domain-containing protein n=2 Tax=Dreissena polymorpha TaxID=45954 RepID=A0A9D4I3Q3_DREPO|nr:hypothetical protein DPMN_181431 [Dreissena polymorpha]
MLVLWVPPWITDRLRYSRPSECYWDPSLNKEFVYIVAIFGHHGPFCIMVSLYTYVFMFMRKRSRTVGVVGSERSATPSIFPPTNSATVSGKDEQLSSRVSLNDRVVASSSKDDEAASFPEPDLSQLDVSRLQVPTSSGKRHGDGRRNKISEASTRSAMRIAREKRVFVTVSYIVIGYAILWLPFHVVFDVSIVDPTLVPVPMLNAAFWMAYINSTLNPFFYNFSCPTFRKTFRQILIRRC